MEHLKNISDQSLIDVVVPWNEFHEIIIKREPIEAGKKLFVNY